MPGGEGRTYQRSPGDDERKRIIGHTLTEIVKQAARLLLIELFMPGGTLVVISILLASRVPAISNRLDFLSPILAATKRPRHQDDLVAHWGLRRMR